MNDGTDYAGKFEAPCGCVVYVHDVGDMHPRVIAEWEHHCKIPQTTKQQEVFNMIRKEREHQDEKWDSQRHLLPSAWYLILGEEIGEVANAILESKPVAEIEEELVQVAAVAVCWLEALRHD